MTERPVIAVTRLEPGWLAAASGCLTHDEEARARRFHHPSDRDTWRAGRAWIRHQLAAALDLTSPQHLTIATDGRGRPYVLGAPPGFDCNWSHSGAWIALAVSWHGPVGIDIEVVRPEVDFDEVVAAVCRPAEAAVIAASAEADARSRLFYRLWTAKEALMKATGLGVALDPADIEVDHADCPSMRYLTHPGWQLAGRESTDWVAAWTWRPSPTLTARS